MGTFSVPVEVTGPSGRRVEAKALADTGATHTLMPEDLLGDLEVDEMEQVAFQLADDREAQYQVGEARLQVDGRERTVLVVFGPTGTKPLIGATSLELFDLAVDPVQQRLTSVPGLLK